MFLFNHLLLRVVLILPTNVQSDSDPATTMTSPISLSFLDDRHDFTIFEECLGFFNLRFTKIQF